ncbi:hypothetical protein ACP26C_23835 (plasmid) [Franconibacter helveticus 513]|uniref:hypothetical protein n=1 Tax=Franconibacter TaxID=1649295 RepID=UPI0004655666|nr:MULTISPECIES: hypothetical protein [Franconibacter]
MTYEQLTRQATKTITDFMDHAKAAGNKHSAEMCFNAAWGAKLLWDDLASVIRDECSELDIQLQLWRTINEQREIFNRIVDRQSVPCLGNDSGSNQAG